MKVPLLGLVQQLLQTMNSDEVEQIDDTEESRQVASICRAVYEELEVLRHWGHKFYPITLETAVDDMQTSLVIPDGVSSIKELRYRAMKTADIADGVVWRKLTYLCPEDFIERSLSLDADDANVVSGNLGDVLVPWPQTEIPGVLYRNDKDPEYWTSFDDKWVYLDSFNTEVDALAVDPANSFALAYVLFPFDETDDTLVFEVPDRDFPLYRAMVKARAFEDIKQISNNGANTIARRMLIRSQKDDTHPTTRTSRGADFGR